MLKPTPGKLKDSVECLAVLSDWICSFGAINDGSSEQYCRIVGLMEKGNLGQTKCIASLGR